MASKESVIRKVQALLAKAMDDSTPEPERLLAQEHADRLMVANMLEEADLTPEERSVVTNKEFKLNINHEFASALDEMMRAVFEHAKCRALIRWSYDAETNTNRRVTIVGTAENISYAEKLWLVVFTHLVRHMFPKWDSAKSFDANVYAYVKAGFKWRQIHEVAWDVVSKHNAQNGLDNDPFKDPISDPYPADKQRYRWEKVYGGDGGRLKRAYAREVKRLGEEVESHTSRHGAYRASYVSSYSQTIRRRLREMRAASEASVDSSSREKYALAVRTTEQVAEEEFYRLFPEYDPANLAKKYAEQDEAERARRAALTPAQREAEDAKLAREYERARKHYAKIQDKSYDSAGWSRGNDVARKVNLNNDTTIKHSSKEIER